MASGEGETPRPSWLLAYYDPVASLEVRPQCMRLCDSSGDGDWRLIAACNDKRMRVMKGTTLSATAALLDEPAAVACFYPDERSPRMPSVAVAAGAYVFIYRNMRPYFKFSLPAMPVSAEESDVWSKLRGGELDVPGAKAALASVREAGGELTVPSVQLLGSSDDAMAREVVESLGGRPLSRHTVVTCLDTIHVNRVGLYETSQLIIGTEGREVLVLRPEGSKVAKRVSVPSVPFMLASYGTFEVDSRVAVACRDGNVYLLKHHKLTSSVCECDTQIISLALLPSAVFVGTMDSTLHCFDYRGKRQWSLPLPCTITAMTRMQVAGTLAVSAVAVALDSGEIRVYDAHKALLMTTADDAPRGSGTAASGAGPPGGAPAPAVNPFDGASGEVAPSDHIPSPELHRLIPDAVEVRDPVTAMAFGRFGREDNSLVTTHESGALTVRILPRRANLARPSTAGPPEEQDVPLPVPRKTRMYLTFAQREKDAPGAMHGRFMQDLTRTRLLAARSYVRLITKGRGPSTQVGGASLALAVRVEGVGPRFRLVVTLTNTGRKVMTDTSLALFEVGEGSQALQAAAAATGAGGVGGVSPPLYTLSPSTSPIPALIPQASYEFPFTVRCVNPLGVAAGGRVSVFLVRPGDFTPILSARVDMPPSQPLEEAV